MRSLRPPAGGVNAPLYFEPLCPELYAVLERWSGAPPLVANTGEGFSGYTTTGGRTEVLHSGEMYRVCCPYCGDTRHRLYVSHRWYEHKFLAHCFNETECLKNPDTRRFFEGELLTRMARGGPEVRAGAIPELDDPTVSVDPPEFVRPLSRVEPTHRVVEYLRARGFDPAYLSAVFAVGVCDSSRRYPAMTGRIYIPVFDGTRMAGWQGRVPLEAPPHPVTGKPDWKAIGVTKYYNRSGFRKSRYLYGPYRDPGLPFVVLVEGVTDAWRVGPAARAYMGVEMSLHQRSIVSNKWGKPGGVVVCMGDGAAQANNEHQAMLLEAELAHLDGRVVKVTLPDKVDPGSLSYDQNWDHIEAATAAAYCPVVRPSGGGRQ